MEHIASAQNIKSNAVQYTKNERTAGYIPTYNTPVKADFQDILQNTQAASHAQNTNNGAATSDNDTFGFFDFLDIINPLQHIPLVNFAYRALTGDEIKPASQIIGGSIYGGPVGMASGIVNAVIKEETGEDMVGNAIAFINPSEETVEQTTLEITAQTERPAYDDLPVSLLEFAHTPAPNQKTA